MLAVWPGIIGCAAAGEVGGGGGQGNGGAGWDHCLLVCSRIMLCALLGWLGGLIINCVASTTRRKSAPCCRFCLRLDPRAIQPPGSGGEGVLRRGVLCDRQCPPHPGGHQEDRSHGGAQVTLGVVV